MQKSRARAAEEGLRGPVTNRKTQRCGKQSSQVDDLLASLGL